MRNISSIISTFGNQIVRQGIALIVRREAFRSLCANSSRALPWSMSHVFTVTWDAMWHVLSGKPVMHKACCYALAKQQERNVRVTRPRSVS